MSRRVFWFVCIVAIVVLCLFLLRISMNKIDVSINDSRSTDNKAYESKVKTKGKIIGSPKERFDVFKPRIDKSEPQERSNRRKTGFEVKDDVLMM